ncbi:hypothetical protein A2366_02485 [Candidatus Woesebacteria bacterium RIFOXYB1_FULL_33_9]|nr:MAG: hypothetical protein A2366_02485 [Candidatus Woesebacteria bacterium RIFOXYB1_FULL_33_9]
MPDQNLNKQTTSPFEIVTSTKKKSFGKKGIIVTFLIVVFLILSVVAGVLLVRQRQNIQEKAQTTTCPTAEQCPVTGAPSHLRNCTPAQADGSPDEQLCNRVGRIGSCGGSQYCCPSLNGAWTKDMTECAAATPTPGPTGSMTCSDNFSDSFDSTIDSAKWSKVGDAKVSSGQLVLDVTSGQQTGSKITSTKYLTGDFVITFDAPALTKTGTGAVTGTLILVSPDGSKIVTVGRNIKQEAHNVAVNFVPGNQNKSVVINGTDSVSFKVERKSGKITTSYKLSNSSTFTELIVFTTTLTDDLIINLIAMPVTGNPLPATTAKFDNFTISCADIVTTPTSTSTSTSISSNTATPTVTATGTSSSGTKTATPTSTTKATGSGTATTAPVPVTGANLPTILGAGFGLIMILVSLTLVL